MKNINLKKLSVALSLTALGLGIGAIVSFLKLPVFLDTIGVMMCTLLLGWRYGLLSAVVTSLFGFFFVSPVIPFFFATMLGLVFFTELCYKWGYYGTFGKTLLAGIGHGIVGTTLSLPVTYLLFGGFTSSGNDLIVSFFVSQGYSILWSVLISLTSFAILDRILTCFFCTSVMKAIPKRFLKEHDFRSL